MLLKLNKSVPILLQSRLIKNQYIFQDNSSSYNYDFGKIFNIVFQVAL